MKQKSKLGSLHYNNPNGVNLVGTGGFGTETSQLSADQAFEVFPDAFQRPGIFFYDKQSNISPIITLKTDVLLKNVNDYPFLPLIGKFSDSQHD